MNPNCAYTTRLRRFNLPNSDAFIDVEHRFFDAKGSLIEQILVCKEPSGIAAFASLMERLRVSGDDAADYGVYAIEADGGFTKVGVSCTPFVRISQLRTASFAELSLSGMVWTRSLAEAVKIESLVVKAAKEMGIWARGEWLRTDADEVIELAIKAARFASIPICDSQTASDNFHARALSLHERKRQAREAVL